jgi:hypothetical protein
MFKPEASSQKLPFRPSLQLAAKNLQLQKQHFHPINFSGTMVE